jgi:hypothetical protein
MNSAPNAAFRVDRSPSLCSAGRFDIIELLHGDLHRLRRPQGARRSPEALVSEKRRMVSAACCERVRASVEVCATCPSIDGPDRRRERLDRGRERLGAPPGAQNSSFLLKLTLDIARELPPRRLKSAAAGRNYTISYLVRPEPEPSAAGRLRTRPAGR